jgi:hypothetical protein
LILVAGGAEAQSAVVKRNVNLRDGPSTATAATRLLLPGEELVLLEPDRTHGYYEVRTASGEEGFVWANNIRVLADATPPAPSGPLEIFNGCGLEGNAQHANRRALNTLKNRITAPSTADLSPTITLAAMLAPGDDRARFQATQAAEVTGFVFEVKAGARETVNCGASGVANTDTHIELTINSSQTAKPQRVVVEVTPRWRAFMAEQGSDWATATLRDSLRGRCAAFTGWMFFDEEHDDESQNTAPNSTNKWRATAWEVHPVTAMRVVPCPN